MVIETADLKMHTYYKDHDGDYVYIHGVEDDDNDDKVFYGMWIKEQDLEGLKDFINSLDKDSLPSNDRYVGDRPDSIETLGYDYDEIDGQLDDWEEIITTIQSWKNEVSQWPPTEVDKS